jgi:ribosomal protein S18 acetylase RimI-like enzyme
MSDLPIEYGIYVSSEADAMVKLLAETFSRRDPPAVAAGLIPSEFEAFVRLLCPNAASQNLTVVARLAGTGELVGVMLTEDCASPPLAGLEKLSPKFDPIFDILGQLDTEYWGSRTARPGEALHLFLLGVSAKVAGRGVAHQLVAECLKNGASRGYRLAVTEATNKVSQHIFRKQGFIPRVQRSYQTHLFNGKHVFASIADHGGPILMDKSLAP